MAQGANCIFCKIIKGEIPCVKVHETEKTLAFMDIQPLSRGHVLVIPKYCGAKLHDIPDEYLVELLPIAKKIAVAAGATDYNILQNNGAIAHQAVFHVHMHMIPKTQSAGLGIVWKTQTMPKDELEATAKELVAKLAN
eukprot:comp11587_c0_seq1/m.6066 comp11587_c0_seq1/g.6066  ORF comp11587_c0_seq1/g.6066 comp11587_c0_seq1/m.6066 type:complete len:138 (-) comp11587_c0_seq1:538-951(-)